MFGQENPEEIISAIADRVKRNRLELNLTQKAMAKRSGLSFGSYCRFENSGEISLKSLVMIAISLDSTEELQALFSKQKFQSIDQIIAIQQSKTKMRGRKND